MCSSKSCFKCSKEKPLTEFYRHSAMADGHLNKCKDCTRSDANNHRLENLDKIRSYDRRRAKNPDRMRSAAEVSRIWRERDSRITAAHNAVARALRSGALIKTPCVRCHSIKSVGHHESYDMPLDVTWLCQPCHKERHKEMGIQGIDPLFVDAG
jgi:hypothetical protein